MKPLLKALLLAGLAGLVPSSGRAIAQMPEAPIPDSTLGTLTMAEVALEVGSLLDAARYHPDPDVRLAAIEVLGHRRAEAAREDMLQLARFDDDRLVRHEAALALARLGDEEGFEILRGLLEGSSKRGGLLIAGQLAELGDASGRDHVASALHDSDPGIRRLAVRFLVPFACRPPEADDAESFERLVAMTADASPAVRLEALAALPRASREGGHPAAVVAEILERAAAEDPDPDVREEIRRRLDYQRWWEEHQEWLKRHDGPSSEDGSGS